ncbi:prealbumin-like fold domain-containing protein [Porticoccus sp.]
MKTNVLSVRGWLSRTLFLVIIGLLSPQGFAAVVGDGIWDTDRDPNVNNSPEVDSDSVYEAESGGTPLPAQFIESFFSDDYNPDPGNDPSLHNDGQKDGQYVKDWECNPPKSAPPKNNLVHGLATFYSNGSKYIFGSASKDADNGTNYLGLWLFLDPNVGCTPNYAPDGTFLGANANGLFGGHHVDGDWLLISDYTNGGGVASFNAYRWNDPNYRDCLNAPGGTKSSCAINLEDGDEVLGHYDFVNDECMTGGKGNGPNPKAPISHNNAANECGPVYTSIDCNAAGGGDSDIETICATTNTETFGSVTAAWTVLDNNGGGGDLLDPPTYFEFAIDIGELVENPPTELGYDGQQFCGGKFMIESRTSAELFGASLKDYILSDFRVCGDLRVVKQTDPTEDPADTDFNFTVTQDPGGTPVDITGLADPTNTLGDGEYFEITDLAVGDYNISEDHPLPPGWTLDDINCVNDEVPPGDEGTDDDATGVDISLGTEKITCTFFNSKPPKLTLVKRVINDDGGTATVNTFGVGSDAGSFSFGAGVADGADTLKYTSNTLTLTEDTYSLTESDVPGYSEGTWSCDGGTGLVNTFSAGSITLANGDDVTCTITNDDDPAALTIVKRIVNDNGGTAVVGDFDIDTDATGAGEESFNAGVADGANTLKYSTNKITDLSAGSYSLAEIDFAGYTEGTWSCDGGTGLVNTYNGGSITLANGDDVTCTITNDDDPTALTIVKRIINDDGGTAVVGDFDIDTDATGAGEESFNAGVADGADTLKYSTNKITDLSAGSYSLAEIDFAGYTEGTWSCDGGTGLVNIYNGGSITLANGDDVTCTITNNDIAPTLKLVKNIDNGDGGTLTITDFAPTTSAPGTFTFGADTNGAADQATHDTGFVTTKAGTYSLSETLFAGYTESAWSCNDAGGNGATADAGTVTLGLAQNITCTVNNNDIAPKLKLVKTVNNGDPSWSSSVADDWTLTADASAPYDGRDKSVAGGSDSLTVVFANNAYALAENGPSGYDASSWDCEDSSGDYAGQSGSSVTLGLADEVTCTITNTARGMVELLKFFNGTLVTTEEFDFTLTGPESLNESDSTPPNPVDFGGAKLIPDTTYTICETGLIAGMTAFWSLDTTEPPDGVGNTDLPFVGAQTGSLWEVYNPDAPAEDLGTRCVDFQVGVGEVVNFVVNNVTPQGDARTPGYWKNWSSCSNGNQFDKATGEYLGGDFDRHWTIDEVLTEASNPPLDPIHLTVGGIIIGDLELMGDPDGDVYDGDSDANCEDAVLVMSSRDLNNPKKNHSSDMAYKLARYLLPFLANQMAGAYSCPYAADVAHESQELLADIGFNGTGDYLDNKSVRQDPSLEDVKDLASFYHGVLGQYVENDPSLNCGDTLGPDEEYPPAP